MLFRYIRYIFAYLKYQRQRRAVRKQYGFHILPDYQFMGFFKYREAYRETQEWVKLAKKVNVPTPNDIKDHPYKYNN